MTDQTEAPERIWAKVKTFSRFYGVNRETEERREWCESYATPEIACICGAVEYTRADLSAAKDKRIEELEAKLAKVVDVLETLRPVWAQGWTNDSMAAQASGTALAQIWKMLGAKNQTQAIATLTELQGTTQ